MNLDEDLSGVFTYPDSTGFDEVESVLKNINPGPRLFLNPRDFVMAAGATYLDVITYSAGQCYLTGTGKISRLLVGIPPTTTLASETRVLPGVHTKLYLAKDNNNKTIEAFIGSMNLVKSTTINLMVSIADPTSLKALKEYFEALWNYAGKL